MNAKEAKDTFQALYDVYVESYRQRDAAGCASIFAQDAGLYSPFGPPAIGRAAIEAVQRDWVGEDGAEAKRIDVVDCGQEGDVGWCLAEYGEGAGVEGVSLNALARQADGSWLITRCSLNEV